MYEGDFWFWRVFEFLKDKIKKILIILIGFPDRYVWEWLEGSEKILLRENMVFT